MNREAEKIEVVKERDDLVTLLSNIKRQFRLINIVSFTVWGLILLSSGVLLGLGIKEHDILMIVLNAILVTFYIWNFRHAFNSLEDDEAFYALIQNHIDLLDDMIQTLEKEDENG